MELYGFQQDAVDALLNGKHIVYANCGVGKTAISLAWARRQLESTGKRKLCVITTASKAATCFPAGIKVATPMGEKNIEDVKEGDIVYSYQEKEGVRDNRVNGVVEYNTCKKLYRIDFGGGNDIIATEDHLFYVGRDNYKRADELKKGMYVYHIEEKPRTGNEEILYGKSETGLCNLWQRNSRANQETKRQLVEKRNHVLFKRLWGSCESTSEGRRLSTEISTASPEWSAMLHMSKTDIISGDDERQKSLLLQNRKSLLQSRMWQKGSSRGHNKLQTHKKRTYETSKNKSQDFYREEYTYEPIADRDTKNNRGRIRVCSRDREKLCSNRLGVSKTKDRNRNRRKISQRKKGYYGRQRERWGIRKVRVENIQILRQDTDRQNTVYCINVENDHNFFANGVLVHNCDWQDEADIFASGLKDMLDEFTIISWHKFSNWTYKHLDSSDWVFIMDECQRCKAGISSGFGRAFLKVTKGNDDWVGMTATPGDTWLAFYPYFTACNFIKNKTAFTKRFCEIQTYKGFPETVGYRETDTLKKWWRAISYSPDTSQMERELPPETHQVIKFKLPPQYKACLKTHVEPVSGDFLDTPGSFTACLRKLCCTPAKMAWIADFVESLNTSCVMFYNFVDDKDKIIKAIKKGNKDAKVWEVDGKTHDIPTAETIGKRDVVLCQWQAGSEAINLQFVNYWVSITPHYSYSISKQARGRIHRIGQTRHMHYYYLQCESGIEQDIYKCLHNKSDFADDVWCQKYGIDNA